jgi:hypothetical protein
MLPSDLPIHAEHFSDRPLETRFLKKTFLYVKEEKYANGSHYCNNNGGIDDKII